jgi:hypothetical protein
MRVGVAAAVLGVMLSASGCGGPDGYTARIAGLPEPVGEAWPARTPWPLESATVDQVLASPDGAPVRLIAYLVAVKVPCPVCNVGTNRPPREDVVGHTARPSGPAPPGCLPCPDPAATVGDEPPTAPDRGGGAPKPRLRAVGVAGGLQPRHVGRNFFFIGVFHAHGPNGPELEVTDVRALDGH